MTYLMSRRGPRPPSWKITSIVIGILIVVSGIYEASQLSWFLVIEILGFAFILIPILVHLEQYRRKMKAEKNHERQLALEGKPKLKPVTKPKQYNQYSDEELDNKVEQYLRKHPGASNETIADQLNVKRIDLADALIRLRKKGKIEI